jgi:hypothetical protein
MTDREAALKAARAFHEAYERLAPQFSYKTREASAKPWDEVPESNRNLMIAVCAEILPTIEREARIEALRWARGVCSWAIFDSSPATNEIDAEIARLEGEK